MDRRKFLGVAGAVVGSAICPSFPLWPDDIDDGWATSAVIENLDDIFWFTTNGVSMSVDVGIYPETVWFWARQIDGTTFLFNDGQPVIDGIYFARGEFEIQG